MIEIIIAVFGGLIVVGWVFLIYKKIKKMLDN